MTKQFLLAAAPPSPGAAAFCFNFRRNNSQNPRLLAPSRPPRRRQSTITARPPYRRVSPPFAPARRHARPRSRGVEERGSRPAMALPARSARAISVQYQASVFNFARSWDQFILISIRAALPAPCLAGYMIRARIGEGRERAKAKGVKMGPKFKLTDHQIREAIKAVTSRASRCARLPGPTTSLTARFRG